MTGVASVAGHSPFSVSLSPPPCPSKRIAKLHQAIVSLKNEVREEKLWKALEGERKNLFLPCEWRDIRRSIRFGIWLGQLGCSSSPACLPPLPFLPAPTILFARRSKYKVKVAARRRVGIHPTVACLVWWHSVVPISPQTFSLPCRSSSSSRSPPSSSSRSNFDRRVRFFLNCLRHCLRRLGLFVSSSTCFILSFQLENRIRCSF